MGKPTPFIKIDGHYLRGRFELPIGVGSKQCGIEDGNVNAGICCQVGACFENQDRSVGVLAESRSNNQASRTATNDDKVIYSGHFVLCADLVKDWTR